MSKLDKNWLEWVVFGVSFVLVIGVLGFLAFDAVTTTDQPPAIDIVLGDTQQTEFQYLVPVSATNRGDATAEQVEIEVTLTQGEEETTSTLAIEFLPRSTTSYGWVAFQDDPRNGELEARVTAFEEP